MTTLNPFDLLGDGDGEDPVQLAAALPVPVSQPKKKPAKKADAELKQEGSQGHRDRHELDEDSFNNENANGSSNGFSGPYRQSENGERRKPYEWIEGYGPSEGESGKSFDRRRGNGGDGGKLYEKRAASRPSVDRDGGKPFDRRGGYGDNGGRTYGKRGGYGDDGGRTYENRGGYGDNGGRTYENRGGYGDNGGRTYENRGGCGDNGGRTYENRGGYGDNGGRTYENRGGYGDNGGRTYENRGGYGDNGGRTYENRGGYGDNGGNTYEKRGGNRTSEVGEGGKSFDRRGGYGGEGGKPYGRRGDYRPSEDGEGGRPFERKEGYGREGGKTYERQGGYRPSPTEEGEMGRPSQRRGGTGGSRGGYLGSHRNGPPNGENANGEHPRRSYERHSGSGNGSEMKRNGTGRGNWGTPTDGVAMEPEESTNEGTKTDSFEKQDEQQDAGVANKGSRSDEQEVKEPEKKLYTLHEYEKLLEEQRKALMALKPEERKVCVDKDFETMQLLANKKNEKEIFIKPGSEKEKKKEAPEKVKKAKPINEILKFADSRRYYGSGGRGPGGRGRGGEGFDGTADAANLKPPPKKKVETPRIEDVAQFPTLGSK